MKNILEILIFVGFVKKKIKAPTTFKDQRFFDGKVRDYCILTGKYRGPAHFQCFVSVKDKKKQYNFIPIIFHNFSKYDCHLFFQNSN